MIIYSDGSCSVNPGPGGYGLVVMNDDETKILDSYMHQEIFTTNNIQELKALIHSFAYAASCPNSQVTIYSDSAYAINVFTQWAKNWEKAGWIKSDNQPIKNLELIKKGYELFKQLNNCQVLKVKGHNNNIGNEMADALASNNINKFNKYKLKLEG